jgi:hypothetical protein
LGEATRAARERVRDQVLRIATSLPGTGGEASAGQVLGISTAKIASACAGGALAAGATCAALGLSPLAVVGLQQDGQASPRVQNRVERIVPEEPRPLPSAVREEPAQTKAPAPEASRSSKAAKPASAASPASEPVLRANDPEAGRKTGQELGLESTGRPPQSSAPSTSASSEESVAPSVGSASSTSAGSTAPAPAPAPSGGGGAPADGGAGLGL